MTYAQRRAMVGAKYTAKTREDPRGQTKVVEILS